MFGAAAAACVVNTGAISSGYLLDAAGLPTPAGAYSLRKLRAAQINAIRIRRTSDGAQTNIGFTSAGDLNTAAITAHCTGGSSGYVVTWYDQSGNGRDLTQSDTTKQMRIYNGVTSTIHTQNSKPALMMTDQYRGMITTAFTPYTGNQASAVVVGTMVSGTTDYSARYASMFPTTTTLGDTETIGAVLVARNGNTEQWGLNRGNGWRATLAGDYDSLQQVFGQIIGGSHSIIVNGELATGTYNTDDLNISRLGVGHRGFDAQSVAGGFVSEVIFWTTSLNTARFQALSQSQNSYYAITPSGSGGTDGPSTTLDWDALGYTSIVYDETFTTGYSHTIGSTTYTNTVDPTHWSIYGDPNGATPGNDGIGFRNPNKVKVVNGALRIEALGDVGGGLAKKNVNGSNMQYGGGEIRWRISDGQGYNPKLVLFPASGNWPWSGVIYLAEVPKGSIDDTLIAKLRKGDDITTKTQVGDWTQWHTTSWVWTSAAIEIYLDGELFWRETSQTYQPTEPLGLVIHYDVGDGDPVALRNSATPQPSFLEIDRITLRKKPGLPGGGGSGGFTNLPNFNLSFVETFDTLAAEGEFLTKYPNWGAYPRTFKDTYGGASGRPANLQSHYEPNIISVAPSADGVTGNVMKMRLHVGTAPLAGAPADNLPWGAAPYPRLPGKRNCRQTFGRYEARFRVVGPVQGWKTAWLLWNTRTDLPKTDPRYLPWPYSGEVDWPEGSLTKTMEVFHHNYEGKSGSDQVHFASGVPYTGWHVWAMEWKPNFCRFILDGNIIGTVTNRVCNEEMRWVMQTETNLGNPRPVAGQQCIVEVDYVVIHSYAA